jgi:hypothetical protein
MVADDKYAERLSAFFSLLVEKRRVQGEALRHVDRYISRRFNVFNMFWVDENKLSDILKELLDPEGTHGQGRCFLQNFLPLLGLSEHLVNAKRIEVIREDPTTWIERFQRRIDVTVHIDDFCVAIENKPWAGEQESQLEDYHRHLEAKHKTSFCLVYLTGVDSVEPTSMDETLVEERRAKGTVRLISYQKDLLPWLEQCVMSCSSDKFRWFLRDFADHVREKFPISESEVTQ